MKTLFIFLVVLFLGCATVNQRGSVDVTLKNGSQIAVDNCQFWFAKSYLKIKKNEIYYSISLAEIKEVKFIKK